MTSDSARSWRPASQLAKVLNHVDRGPRATAVYDRYSYDTEKRAALEAWERRLSAILSEQQPAENVLPFKRG